MTTVTLPTLHTYQAKIVAPLEAGAVRFGVLACGRRFGKSLLGAWLLERGALTKPAPYAYYAPTYKTLSEVWRELKERLHPVITDKSEVEKRLTLATGGVIECWSLDDPDASRGRKYAGAVIDEAAKVRSADAWPATIRPTLADLGGWALFLSTPRGKNWFYRLWQQGRDYAANPDWYSWRYPTTANPTIPGLEAEVTAARRDTPELLWRQEYLAAFLEGAGVVFRGVRQVATGSRQREPDPEGEYVVGVDWARHNDFTVIAVFDRRTRTMVDLDRFNNLDWETQRGRIHTMIKRWNVIDGRVETNSIGEPNLEELQREGLPLRGFQTTSASKPPLIQSLILGIEQHELTLLNDPVLIGELEAFEQRLTPSGRTAYGAPDGLHDDTVIATALAWDCVVNSGRAFVEVW